MNRTELRQQMRMAGLDAPYRHSRTEELRNMIQPPIHAPAQQHVMRARTEQFVQRHWSVLQETLSCSGNCSSPENTCPDAQASACFHQNQSLFDD